MAVLIKGQSIKCSRLSRQHYLHGPENERITVREVRGLATKDPDEALQMLEILAKGTRCQRPVYSAKINPETDRIWNKDEIRRAVDLLEENLGLTGHPRAVVEHKKDGRIHFHVLWSRFHPDGGPAMNMGHDYAVHQKTQRQLEKELKLRPMMAKGRDFKKSEVEWARRYGFDIFVLKKQITHDFHRCKTGQEFMAALKEKGVVLCRGHKSQFVLILPWGQHKALSSMIHGRPTKAILRRALIDIELSRLPTVSEAEALVKVNLPKVKRRPWQSRRINIEIKPSGTSPSTKVHLPTHIHGTTKVVFRQPVQAARDHRQEHQKPVPIRSNKKGWPEAAIIAWEAWGKHHPAMFFRIWSELAGPVFSP